MCLVHGVIDHWPPASCPSVADISISLSDLLGSKLRCCQLDRSRTTGRRLQVPRPLSFLPFFRPSVRPSLRLAASSVRPSVRVRRRFSVVVVFPLLSPASPLLFAARPLLNYSKTPLQTGARWPSDGWRTCPGGEEAIAPHLSTHGDN